MTTTPTPGPWSLFQQGDEYGCWGGDGARERVFSIRQGVIPMNPDARLIAAAPEMREWLTVALEGLNAYYAYGQEMRKIGRGFDWGDTPGASTETFVKRARALLAKIEGKE